MLKLSTKRRYLKEKPEHMNNGEKRVVMIGMTGGHTRQTTKQTTSNKREYMNWTNNEEFLLEIPEPSKTHSYSPIPHSMFIQELQEQLDKKELQVCDKKYMVNRDGNIMTGEYGICGKGESCDEEAIMSIG